MIIFSMQKASLRYGHEKNQSQLNSKSNPRPGLSCTGLKANGVDLTFTTLWASSAEDKLGHISYFPQKTGLDISCKFYSLENIFMKCQILFSGKKIRKYFNISSAKISKSVKR